MAETGPKGQPTWRGQKASGNGAQTSGKTGRFILAVTALALLLALFVGLIKHWMGQSQPPIFITVFVEDYKPWLPDFNLANRDRESFKSNLSGLLQIDSKTESLEAPKNFEAIASRIRSADANTTPVVVYVSTLAATVRGVDGKKIVCLLPGQAEADDLDKPDKLIPLAGVLRAFKECPGSKKILVLDIMAPLADPRIGVLVDDVAETARQEVDRFEEAEKLGGAVIFACSKGETAYASEDLRRTVFGYYFEEGIRGYADRFSKPSHNEGRVMALGLARFVQQRVARWAADNRLRSQTPDFVGIDDRLELLSTDDTRRRTLGHSIPLADLAVDEPPPPEATASKDAKPDAKADEKAKKDAKHDEKSAKDAKADKKTPDAASKPVESATFVKAIMQSMPDSLATDWELRNRVNAQLARSPASGGLGQLLRRVETDALFRERTFRGLSAAAGTKNGSYRSRSEELLREYEKLAHEQSNPTVVIPSLGFAQTIRRGPEADKLSPEWEALKKKVADKFAIAAKELATKDPASEKAAADRNDKIAKMLEELYPEIKSENALAVAALAIEEAVNAKVVPNTGVWQMGFELAKKANGDQPTLETAWLRRAARWQEATANPPWPFSTVAKLLEVVCAAERLADDPAAFVWIEPEAQIVAESIHRMRILAMSPGYVSIRGLEDAIQRAKTDLGKAREAKNAVAEAYRVRDQAFKELPAYWGYVDLLATGEVLDSVQPKWKTAIESAVALCRSLDSDQPVQRAKVRQSLVDLATKLHDDLKDMVRVATADLDKIVERSQGEVRSSDAADCRLLEALLAIPNGSLQERRRIYSALRRISSRLNKATLTKDWSEDEVRNVPPEIGISGRNKLDPSRVAKNRADILKSLLSLGGWEETKSLEVGDDQVALGLSAKRVLFEVRRRLLTPAQGEVNQVAAQRLAWVRLPDLTGDDEKIVDSIRDVDKSVSPQRQRGLAAAANWFLERSRRQFGDPAAFIADDGADSGSLDLVGSLRSAEDFDGKWRQVRDRYASNQPTPANPPAVAFSLEGAVPQPLTRPGASWANVRIRARVAASASGVGGTSAPEFVDPPPVPDGDRFSAGISAANADGKSAAVAQLNVALREPTPNTTAPRIEPRGFIVRVELDGAGGRRAYHYRQDVGFELTPSILLTNVREPGTDVPPLDEIEIPGDPSTPARLFLFVKNTLPEVQKFDVRVLDGGSIPLFTRELELQSGQLGEVAATGKKELAPVLGPLVVKVNYRKGKPFERRYNLRIARQTRLKQSDIRVEIKRSKKTGTFDLEVAATNTTGKAMAPPCEIAIEVFDNGNRLLEGPRTKLAEPGETAVLPALGIPIRAGGRCELCVRVDGKPRQFVYGLQMAVGNNATSLPKELPMLRLMLEQPKGEPQPKLDATYLDNDRLLFRAAKGKPTQVAVTVMAANETLGDAKVRLRLFQMIDRENHSVGSRGPFPARSVEYKFGTEEGGALLFSGRLNDPTQVFEIANAGEYEVVGELLDAANDDAKTVRKLVVDDTEPDIGSLKIETEEIRAGRPVKVIAEGSDSLTPIDRVFFFIGKKPAEGMDPDDMFKAEEIPTQPGVYRCNNLKFTKEGRETLWVAFENKLKMRSYQERKVEVLAAPKMDASGKYASDKKVEPGSISGKVISHNDRPVEDLEVVLQKLEPSPTSPDGKFKTIKGPVKSGKDGVFNFANIPPGEYRLLVDDKKLRWNGTASVTVVSGEDVSATLKVKR